MSLRSEVTRIFNELIAGSKKITDLPSATTPLTGTELFEIVQGGENKKVAASNFGGGGGGTWGSITGTLSDQTDLNSALNAKLVKANNLSDLANAATARTNLGLGTVATRTAPSGTLVGTSDTQTLTNKRITPRIQSVTSSATVTPDADANDAVKITAQAAGLTLANPTGTPDGMQAMVIRIKDNGTARSIAYGTQYRAIGITLPTTTVISKTIYLGMIYNSDDSKWDVTGYSLEA